MRIYLRVVGVKPAGVVGISTTTNKEVSEKMYINTSIIHDEKRDGPEILEGS